MKAFVLLPSILLFLVYCSFSATVLGQADPNPSLDAMSSVLQSKTSQVSDQQSQSLEPAATPAPGPETAPAAAPAAGPETAAPEPSLLTVKAYYFHGERRCKTCLAIETNTQEAIEKGYADETAQGMIVWQSVNIDQKENNHFEKEFDLMFSSVILVKYRDGKQVEWKNLQKVWELVWDKPAFEDYIRSELRSYLES